MRNACRTYSCTCIVCYFKCDIFKQAAKHSRHAAMLQWDGVRIINHCVGMHTPAMHQTLLVLERCSCVFMNGLMQVRRRLTPLELS